MAEAVAGPEARRSAGSSRRGGVAAIAWRNLWRNRRRTLLTAGGIAFAVWMLVFSRSMQDGTFDLMIDNGARLMTGHAQLQHPDYQDNPLLEHLLGNTAALVERVEGIDGVLVASPRTAGFALVSSGERSFGAQIIGVDAGKEQSWSTLPGMVQAGRYIERPGEAFIGAALARNLGVDVGGELVVLGTALEGGVAAIVAEVVGIFSTGQAELDRAVVQVPINDFRAGWELAPDAAHEVIVLTSTVRDSELAAADLQGMATDGAWRVLDWRELMPDAVQTIELKEIGTIMFFSIIAMIVTFSVVNTFMMTVFERTPEFGMLMAIGMKPGRVVVQLQLEALWMSLLGIGIGLLVSAALVSVLGATGIPLPVDAAELMAQYNIPDRVYPAFSTRSAWIASIIMLVGTQIAVVLPALRIRRMRPVQALRAQE